MIYIIIQKISWLKTQESYLDQKFQDKFSFNSSRKIADENQGFILNAQLLSTIHGNFLSSSLFVCHLLCQKETGGSLLEAILNNEIYVCFPVTVRKQDFIAKKDQRNQSSMTAMYSKLLSESVVRPRVQPGPLPAPSPGFSPLSTHCLIQNT